MTTFPEESKISAAGPRSCCRVRLRQSRASHKGGAYVGSVGTSSGRPPEGFTVHDVRDPRKYRKVAEVKSPSSVHSHKLRVVDPEKINVPTLIMRGQWDGIASMEDLVKFFERLPNPDKHFAVMPGISHASFQQKNYALVYHILWTFFTQPTPLYRG